jgi:threonine/homoserine/homoserine lactone efflux protein
MPDPSRLALFVGAALLLLVVPGPSVLYIVTQSVSHGRRAGIVSVAGITTGTLVHIAAATVGLSALFASSALAFDVVKYLGAAYLIAVGIRRLAGWERDAGPRARDTRDLGRLYRQGIVVNTLNPKTALFFLAFLPQFVDPDRGPVALQAAVLGAVFVVVATVSDSTYAVVTAAVADRVRGSSRARQVRRYLSSSIFVALGVTAATAHRA